LLPGALVRNQGLHFICDRAPVRVEQTNRVWTQAYQPQQILTLPIAHGEGRYYADAETIRDLEANQQVLFRYCSQSGEVNPASNPNGSIANIAGITNRSGNVLGMMPHPERAADPLLGAIDGLGLFKGLLSQRVAV
jgi:phosphoribosylformylglycinamidine synthase